MHRLLITDSEAEQLIKTIKYIIKKYNISLKPGNKGYIELKSNNDNNIGFLLHYFISKNVLNKMSLHLRQKHTNINLIRINIDPNGFHKNSNNHTIYGNRILIYSTSEWIEKADGKTYVKAYDVPNEFTDTDSLEQVFLDFLVYINVKEESKVFFRNELL